MPDKGSPLPKAAAVLSLPGPEKKVVEVSVRECAIHSAVVFKDRAEVKRVVPARLAAGENEVVVSGLASCVDKNSIRVEGQGDVKATITDVIYSSETTSEEVCSGSKEDYEQLRADIEEKKAEKKRLRLKHEVITGEKALLTKFASHICQRHSVDGEGESLSQLVEGGAVGGVMAFMQRFEAKAASLDGRLLELTNSIRKLEEKIRVLKANAEKVNPERKEVKTDTVRSLRVSLECEAEADMTLIVSYVVSNASWTAAYDVRVFTKDKAMKVQYYGLIKQSTGEDWIDASISLSTAQPSIGGSAPALPTKIIRFYRPPPRPRPAPQSYSQPKKQSLNFLGGGVTKRYYNGAADESGYLNMRHANLEGAALAVDSDSDEESWGGEDGAVFSSLALGGTRGGAGGPPPPPGGLSIAPRAPPPPALDVAVAAVNIGLFNATYAIPRKTTIPADSTEHKVTVALVDLQPELHYTSVPRLSPHSFLQAKAKNTSPYTMLAGPANIFLDNNFIAKSELSDVSPNESFTTSLGADQAIRITCEPIAVVHASRSGLTKKQHVLTYTHTFQVKNTRPTDVSLQVSEQVPLSTDERIKVVVVNPDLKKQGARSPLPSGYATLNDDNNVEWHVSMATGAELSLHLVYTVEYPQQDDVQGLPK